MNSFKIPVLSAFISASIFLLVLACSKGGEAMNTQPPSSACEGVTVSVSTVAEETNPGAATGQITIVSPKGTGITYKLNSGNFQPLPSYVNLAKGTYTITAKTASGCLGTTTVVINEKSCAGSPGPKFISVKNIVQAKCAIAGCHVSPSPTGNLNLQVDCNIVFNRDKIFDRAVTVGDMPQTGSLTNAEKQFISAWISAGGRITD